MRPRRLLHMFGGNIDGSVANLIQIRPAVSGVEKTSLAQAEIELLPPRENRNASEEALGRLQFSGVPFFAPMQAFPTERPQCKVSCFGVSKEKRLHRPLHLGQKDSGDE